MADFIGRDSTGHEFVVTWQPMSGHMDPVAVARFARFVDISGGLYACWPWMGSGLPSGYGRFSYQGRVVNATRFSLELHLGRPIASGMQACHTCDNPPCVNPAHLFEGSVQDNVDDMMAKGRWSPPPRTAPDVDRLLRVRALADEGLSDRQIAKRLNVSRQRAWELRHTEIPS